MGQGAASNATACPTQVRAARPDPFWPSRLASPRRRAVCAQAPCAPRAERCCVRAVAGPGDGPSGGTRHPEARRRRPARCGSSSPHPHTSLSLPTPGVLPAPRCRLTRSPHPLPAPPSPTHSVRSPVACPCGGRLSLAAATRGGDGGGREAALREGRRGRCPPPRRTNPEVTRTRTRTRTRIRKPEPEPEPEPEPRNPTPTQSRPRLDPDPDPDPNSTSRLSATSRRQPHQPRGNPNPNPNPSTPPRTPLI